MYVSKFQRYGGAVIVVVLAVAVGAGMLPGADASSSMGGILRNGASSGYHGRTSSAESQHF